MGLYNSNGLFDGLICGDGAYIRGGLIHGVITKLAISISQFQLFMFSSQSFVFTQRDK